MKKDNMVIDNLLSIITVCYNDSKNLSKTISSIKKLKLDQFEYIIIDGGSTDNTKTIIKNNLDIITHYISEKDNGIFDAMNKGTKLAKGQYIIYMNAGDEFVSNEFYNYLQQSSNISIIYGNTHYPHGIKSPWHINSLKYGRIMACHQSMIFNKKVIGSSLFYNTRFKLYCDYDLVSRIYKLNLPIKRINSTISKFQGGGVSSIVNSKERISRYYFVYKNFGLLGIIRATLEKLKILKLPVLNNSE